jgi:hypothetical protein
MCVKIGLEQGEGHPLGVSDNKVLKGVFDSKMEEVMEVNGENRVTSFIICAFHVVIFG